ncbi:MAG: iron ABC transporter permease [Verrucomicrobiae bacterium]|nr:iron ABC transporter permease [Verrucomicrobiae bacterium]
MKNRWKFRTALALVFAFLALFLVWPMVYVVRESVWIEQEGRMRFTLVFFRLFAQSPFMWACLLNSLALAACSTAVCTAISLPLAQLFARRDFPGKTFWQALLMGPLILPPFVGAIGVQQIFARFGALNHWLGLVGPGVADPHPVDWLGAGGFAGIVAMQSLHLFPILFLNLTAAMANINPAAREAARGLGAGPWRVFRTVTLPLLAPGFFAGAILVFVWAFTDLGTPLIFGYSNVVAVQIFDKVTEAGFNPFGYALVIVVLATTTVLFLASRRLLARQDYVTQGKASARDDLEPLRGRGLAAATAGLALISFLALLPHASVLLQSLSDRWFMSALPERWTLEPYREVFTLPQTVSGLRNSLFYSSLSALVDVGLGVTIAWWLARKEFAGKALLDALTVLPLALPGIVLAFGYVMAFDVPASWRGFDLSGLRAVVNPRENPMLLLVVSYSVRRLPFLVRSVHAGLRQMSVSLEEASRNLGAGPAATVRRIVLPLVRGNVIAGAALTFAFAFLEVSDSLILAMKEEFYPVTKTIWALMGRIEPGAGAVASALGVLGMLLLFAAFFLANHVLGRRMGNLFG